MFVQFFYDTDQGFFFNELNTLPGFTDQSMYPKLCEATGYGYSQLLNHLILLATVEFEQRGTLMRHYEPAS